MKINHNVTFENLRDLNQSLRSVCARHLKSLTYFESGDGVGFYHHSKYKRGSSLSSTCACISSLVSAGLWQEEFDEAATARIAKALTERRRVSGELSEDNYYSNAFVIDGVLSLQDAYPTYEGASDHLRKLHEEVAPPLIAKLESDGAIGLDPYPVSAYLTELVLRTVRRLKLEDERVDEAIAKRVNTWANQEINRQIVLISAKSSAADPLDLASSLILSSLTATAEKTTPEEKLIIQYGLDLFFSCQNDDGSWPHGRTLFHSPSIGNAYVFEYELLTQLLLCPPLRSGLLLYIPHLARSAERLDRLGFDLDVDAPGRVTGWASGQHAQIQGPESWSTACVYDFCYALAGLVSEAIRRAAFSELGANYWPPRRPLSGDHNDVMKFASKMLDASLIDGSEKKSLRKVLAETFVFPIAREWDKVAKGHSLNSTTPMSAILFGPPGTSKTQLAKYISEYLGWPLLPVDPSYLVKEGLDRIQAMAGHLFDMLIAAEQIVVLLDEFDEMGRDRSNNNELLSRFITTMMLPKLTSINERRKIVFLLATNYIDGFDAAFRRGGRFDLLIQVMPPSLEAKLENWPPLAESLGKLTGKNKSDCEQILSDLTYLECEQLVLHLKGRLPASAGDAASIVDACRSAHEGCTLNRKTNNRTLKATCEEERKHIRIDRRSA